MIDDFLNTCYSWLVGNWQSIVFSITGIVVVYAIYKLLSREINRFKNQEKIDENIAFNLNRLLKWISVLAVLGIVATQFVVDLSPVIGFMALAGGTIIGFASMNTIGNAIAGIIVTFSKPFKIGDRLFLNEEFADVIAIDLIYTRMKTLDNVLISIPNQQLLTTKIDNYGVEGILKEPRPYVFVTNFFNFAVEYSLYVFTSQINKLRLIDSNLKRTVLDVCRKNGIDLTTPSLIQSVGEKSNAVISE